MKIILRMCLIMLTVVLFACGDDSGSSNVAQEILNNNASFKATLTPDFTFASFQRFWHRAADHRVTLENAKESPNGYMVDFGQGVTLHIFVHDTMISGVRVEYIALDSNFSGGLQFKRIVDHMLLVGTFFWKKEIRAQLIQHFSPISQAKKEFMYKRSYFMRTYSEPLWTFDLFFVDEGEEVRMAPGA